MSKVDVVKERNDMRQERYYTPEERARIVAELMAPGADVHGLLKKHGLPRSTFYDWRRQYRIEHGQECPTECSRRNLRMLAKALERERTLREILMVATCAPGGTLGERLRAMSELDGRYAVHALCDAFGVDRGTLWWR